MLLSKRTEKRHGTPVGDEHHHESSPASNLDIMVVNTDVLNSWKEVATYLGRGIRTVQRWERELGLPVRRPRGKSRSPVIAFRPELDHWLQNAPMAERPSSRENQAAETSQAASSSLQEAA
jgi:hypothetical protein